MQYSVLFSVYFYESVLFLIQKAVEKLLELGPCLDITPPIRRESSAAWMLEALFELPHVADKAQALAFGAGKIEIHLHAYNVDDNSEP